MSENTMSPVRSSYPVTRDREREGSDRRNVTMPERLMTERIARDDLKWYLVNKYRPLLVDKLSREDLEELQVLPQTAVRYKTRMGP